jgi:hypothetical protein
MEIPVMPRTQADLIELATRPVRFPGPSEIGIIYFILHIRPNDRVDVQVLGNLHLFGHHECGDAVIVLRALTNFITSLREL